MTMGGWMLEPHGQEGGAEPAAGGRVGGPGYTFSVRLVRVRVSAVCRRQSGRCAPPPQHGCGGSPGNWCC